MRRLLCLRKVEVRELLLARRSGRTVLGPSSRPGHRKGWGGRAGPAGDAWRIGFREAQACHRIAFAASC
jgi:hypothetical protein